MKQEQLEPMQIKDGRDIANRLQGLFGPIVSNQYSAPHCTVHLASFLWLVLFKVKKRRNCGGALAIQSKMAGLRHSRV
jgi:hypothetical protein